MNGLCPPPIAPSGFEDRQPRGGSKECCRPVLSLWVGDPVECVGVSQKRNGNVLNVKPPAMRVRNVCYTPKYRRKIVYNQYKTDLRDILKQLCSYKGVEIIEGHLMPDHVHMLVSIPPKISVSSFMGYLKGKSALMMFDKHANLKYKFGNRHFWSQGYYVSTVGLNEATIKKYIQEQEKADIMQDKLSVKEYEDPFKGQG